MISRAGRRARALVVLVALMASVLAVGSGSAHASEHCDQTVSSPGTGADIQAAINAAPAGGTVCLEAGTYLVAATINVNKPVTIEGPNAGNDPTAAGARSPEAVVQKDGTSSIRGLRLQADDVTITGLTITGFSNRAAIWHNGADAVAGVTISNNIFDGNSEAFGTSQAAEGNPNLIENVAIEANLIRNNSSRAISSYTGVRNEGFDIIGNEFDATLVAIHLGFVDGAVISGNSFTVAPGFYSVLLASDIANVEVSGNDFDGGGTTGPALWTWSNPDGSGTSTLGPVTVTDNDITGYGYGIRIRGTGTDATPWEVTGNRIEGNTVGVENNGIGTLDATCNWWGASNGPGGDGPGDGDPVEGDVSFTPWSTGPDGPCELPPTDLPVSIRGNQWLLRNSLTSGPAEHAFRYGHPDVQQLYGDWDGDGIDTPGVFNPDTGWWHITNSPEGPSESSFRFGDPGDVALAGDWDGDGIEGIGVRKAGTSRVHLRNSASAGTPDLNYRFALPTSTIVVGDWNGDEVDTLGARHAGSNWFHLTNGHDTAADTHFPFGSSDDHALAGDWDGDGDDTIGVRKATYNLWQYRNENSVGAPDGAFNFGQASDTPLLRSESEPALSE